METSYGFVKEGFLLEKIKRGDIVYIEKSPSIGSEQHSGRPAVIVSNDKNNQFADTVEVVYLTTAPKNDLLTHVTIRSAPKESIALCEQVTTVSASRIGNFISTATAQEMRQIDTALLISLDLYLNNTAEPETITPIAKPEPAGEHPRADFKTEWVEVAALKAELRVYKKLCADLLDRITDCRRSAS